MKRSSHIRYLVSILGAVSIGIFTAHAGALPVDGNGLQAWFDGGQGVVTDGVGRVQAWLDQSGSGNHAVQNDSATYRPYVTTSALFNGQQVLDHFAPEGDGATYYLDLTNAVPAKTMFYVYSLGDLTRRQDNIYGSGDLAFHNIIVPTSYRTSWLLAGITDFTTPDLNPHVYQYYANSTTPYRELRDDGASIGSNVGSFTDGSIARIGWGNSGSGNQAFKGMNAEIIIYNTALNSAQRLITENYLAAKYAIALDSGAKKYAGADSAKGDYDFEVIGIGRASDGSNTLSGAGGGGLILAQDLLAPLSVGDYVLAGHKSGTNSFVATDLPSGFAERWSRVWYLDVTGTPGANLTFDFSDGGLAGQFDLGKSYRLLYSVSNSFGFADLGLTPTTNGDQVTFDLTSAPAVGYYTLAAAIPEPSIVALVSLCGLALLRRRR